MRRRLRALCSIPQVERVVFVFRHDRLQQVQPAFPSPATLDLTFFPITFVFSSYAHAQRLDRRLLFTLVVILERVFVPIVDEHHLRPIDLCAEVMRVAEDTSRRRFLIRKRQLDLSAMTEAILHLASFVIELL